MRFTACCLIGGIGLMMAACAAPRAHFQLQNPVQTAPAKVALEEQSENADSIVWDFGDGTVSSEPMPTHRYLKSGRYTISLKAIKGKKISETSKELIVHAPERCLVEIQTPMGNMLVELYEETPQHRENFLKLAEDGFFDGLLFHRVIDGFMIQGGDPDSRNAEAGKMLGTGGPGYEIPAEIRDEYVHVKGALAAARKGDAVNPEQKSSGSQFYIVQGQPVPEEALRNFELRRGDRYTDSQREAYTTLGGTPFLDGSYTVFGRVVEGLDVIDRIADVETDRSDRPEENVDMRVIVVK